MPFVSVDMISYAAGHSRLHAWRFALATLAGNTSGTRSVGLFSIVMAVLKVGGIALFGAAGLWASGISFKATGGDMGASGFVASVALSILAFKGFTTITNSGAEITKPHQNVGRAIVLSIAICVVVYLLVAFAVGSSLPLDRIVAAKDYALAERPNPPSGRLAST